MNGEFTSHCSYYYELTQQLETREERFNNLLDNAPPYCGQTNLSEIDDLISYYRQVQDAKAEMEKTCDDMRETERTILKYMQHFEMPPGTILNGEIPGELAYEIWANENDTIYINKTKDLQPEPDNANIIEIKLWNKGDGED